MPEKHNNSPDKQLRRKIDKRRKLFLSRLSEMSEAPACKNTHATSTALRRLLVLDRLVRNVYNHRLIKKEILEPMKGFRRILADLRDAQEIGLKFSQLFEEHRIDFFQKAAGSLKEKEDQLTGDLLPPKRFFAPKALAHCLRKSRVKSIVKGCPAAGGKKYLNNLQQTLGDTLEASRKQKLPAQLHQVRIALKKYRYAAELLEKPLAIPKSALKKLHDLQDCLGEAHDWLVLLQTAELFESEQADRSFSPQARAIVQEHFDQTHQAAWDALEKNPNVLTLV